MYTQRTFERTGTIAIRPYSPEPFDRRIVRDTVETRGRHVRKSTVPDPPNGSQPRLSPRAIAVLRSERARRARTPKEAVAAAGRRLAEADLARIAARCSRAELLAGHGVGPKLVEEIEAWLAGRGKRLRSDPLPTAEALAQALRHIAALLDRGDDGTFLAAFVALPELRRSLTLPGRASRGTAAASTRPACAST